MSQFTGMNIAEVRQLSQRLSTAAEEIEQLMGQLTSQLGGTSWVGNDRNRFESDWQGAHCSALRNVAGALRDAATRANGNADEQESASA